MKHSINIISFIFFVVSFTCCVTDDEPDPEGLTVGDTLPEFSVTLNTGEEITTSSLRGKTPVIVFFNTSCPDCRMELPVVQRLWDECKGNPEILIFAIAREQDAPSISEYWNENGLSIPYSAQPDRRVYNLFASSIIPRIYIADTEGVITATFVDDPLPTLNKLKQCLDLK